MLRFISRLPKYSPFNCMLLYEQNPGTSYVATATTWLREFRRHPKHDARPLIILAPMGPVAFVYDLKDTEGDPVPEKLIRPFDTTGSVDESTYHNTIHNSGLHGIAVIETLLAHKHAGTAIRVTNSYLKRYKNVEVEPWMRYLVLINKEYTLEDKYLSLAHELAHIFCGHVGIDIEAWWLERQETTHQVMEIEAESVAYLVCRRKGLKASSDDYLSGYRDGLEKEMPVFSLHDVIMVTTYIEDMGKKEWEKPKKKSRYKKKKD